MDKRLCSIESDTNDTPDYLMVPKNVKLAVAKADYDKWYYRIYVPSLQHKVTAGYMTFSEYLVARCGATTATKEIEVFSE